MEDELIPLLKDVRSLLRLGICRDLLANAIRTPLSDLAAEASCPGYVYPHFDTWKAPAKTIAEQAIEDMKALGLIPDQESDKKEERHGQRI